MKSAVALAEPVEFMIQCVIFVAYLMIGFHGDRHRYCVNNWRRAGPLLSPPGYSICQSSKITETHFVSMRKISVYILSVIIVNNGTGITILKSQYALPIVLWKSKKENCCFKGYKPNTIKRLFKHYA